MRKVDENAFMYRIANMYYRDGISQSEIAQTEKVSRSQISRMLNKARAQGLVNITIRMPQQPNTDRLQENVKSILGLKDVFVLPIDVTQYANDDNLVGIKDAAELAAPIISKLLSDCTMIGVGWGRSLYYLSLSVQRPDISHCRTFVPLSNGFGQSCRYLQPSIIANNFAEKFDAETFFLSLPNGPTDSNYWSLVDNSILEKVQALWNRLDGAIISLGPMNPAENIYYTELLKTELSGIKIQPDICGEIVGMGFTKEGKAKPQSHDFIPCAYPIENLRKIKNAVAFAFGPSKVTPLYCAAKSGFFNILVTDISTAKGLLGL